MTSEPSQEKKQKPEVGAGPPRRPARGRDGLPRGPAGPPSTPRSGAGSEVRSWGREGPSPAPAGTPPPDPGRRGHAPRDPSATGANGRPSPEEGVRAVVVDLGLGAATARARPARSARGPAIRGFLQRGLAHGHRRPRPRPLSALALAPPHGAPAPAARPGALTPRTRITARPPREGRREGVAALPLQGLQRAEAGGGQKRAGGALWGG